MKIKEVLVQVVALRKQFLVDRDAEAPEECESRLEPGLLRLAETPSAVSTFLLPVDREC